MYFLLSAFQTNNLVLSQVSDDQDLPKILLTVSSSRTDDPEHAGNSPSPTPMMRGDEVPGEGNEKPSTRLRCHFTGKTVI